MKRMTYDDFARVRDAEGYRLIDVRESDEWDEVHVRGAEHFPLSKIREGELPEPDDRPVAVICRSGGRSQIAIGEMEKAGWSECVNIEGGTLAAVDAGEEHVERS